MRNKIFFYAAITFIFYLLQQTQINENILLIGIVVCIFIFESTLKKPKISSTNERADTLFFKSPSMIVKVETSDWSILKINEILGLTLVAHPYQVEGQPIDNLFTKDDSKKLKKALHELKRKGMLRQYTSELVTTDNDKIHVTIDGVMSTNTNEPNTAYLYITNISSIKKIESKLESNRNLLQNIIDKTLEAVIITNKYGKIIEWNPQAAQLIGQGKINVINKSISQVIIGSDDTKLSFEKDITNYLSNRETEYIGRREIVTIITKSNKKTTVASCCFPVLSDDGNYVFCFFLHDITELKRNENRIKELMSELEDSNKELQSFAYIASHDLKTPLMGIKNYAVILKNDYEKVLDEAGAGFLNSLINSCGRLELLLESLLHYSKVGNLQLHLTKNDPNLIVTQVKESIHHMLKEKNALIAVDGQLPHVMADESRLNEVFTNLITNALKYNDKNNPLINIGFSPEKSTSELHCFYVKDNGIGIEKDKIDKVFEIFQRLHKKEEYGGGAGAGLTITKRIIERHNGYIWVESAPGTGTTFYFTLMNSDVIKPKENNGIELLLRDNQNGTNKNPLN